MIYGFAVIKTETINNWSTDYVDEINEEILKVRLFAQEKDRDKEVTNEYQRQLQKADFNVSIKKFVTKEDQGGLIIMKK